MSNSSNASMFTPLQSTLIGVGLNLCASSGEVLGIDGQKFVQMRLPQGSADTAYLTQPLWWCFFFTFVGSSFLAGVALNFVSQSIVALSASWGVVVNLVGSSVFLGEPLFKIDVAVALFVVSGVAVSISFAHVDELDYTAAELQEKMLQPAFLVCCAVDVLLMAIAIQVMSVCPQPFALRLT